MHAMTLQSQLVRAHSELKLMHSYMAKAFASSKQATKQSKYYQQASACLAIAAVEHTVHTVHRAFCQCSAQMLLISNRICTALYTNCITVFVHTTLTLHCAYDILTVQHCVHVLLHYTNCATTAVLALLVRELVCKRA
jgi:hypothetical protein